ncbi:methyltransferase (TIGR00027 family) [Variovorax boronicumulans]|uniref:class I SAM-dependent methyltransferase n=1 Tax=Variovorax boronicumulans TaxID=436515 RepID=UPI002474C373|nr:class I SAM-dependent methyltransferase [Variovorax boronicumulans]MDH6168507.1 methyltransferase (TIGR00027 family) [Variovorax boronicumulans]
MDSSKASHTALATSLMRALHARSDPAPLLDDPWGDRLVPETVRAALRERAMARLDPALRATASPDKALDAALRANAAYADVILRSRYTEDMLKAAVERGITQYVLIGAGFDSFLCRRPAWAEGLKIYEVDHPATQQLKRRQLQHCGIAESDAVQFVAADLSEETLQSALARSSFQPTQPTFFSWLGVTVYLTREANLATLRAIASVAPAGSELVFTYVDEAVLRPGHANTEAFNKLRSDVSSVGESFLSGFDPATLGPLLLETGLLLLEDLGGNQAVARYDAAGAHGLRWAGAGHLAHACVVNPEQRSPA